MGKRGAGVVGYYAGSWEAVTTTGSEWYGGGGGVAETMSEVLSVAERSVDFRRLKVVNAK